MAQRFSDQVVWITGGGSGIGRATALRFGAEGAKVAISGRRRERLEAVAAEISAAGGRGAAVPCDVSDDDQLDAAVADILDRWGRLDVALANAGYSVGGKVASLDRQTWQRQLEINVVSAAMTVRVALPALRETRGRLGLVGSVAGFICAPGMGAYSASKYAIRALGATLSVELHGSGVSCTTVHPGYVASEIAQVDNAGTFIADRVDKRPSKLLWPADKAAGVIVNALYRRRREVVFTGHGKVGAFVGQHLPGLAHVVMRGGMFGKK